MRIHFIQYNRPLVQRPLQFFRFLRHTYLRTTVAVYYDATIVCRYMFKCRSITLCITQSLEFKSKLLEDRKCPRTSSLLYWCEHMFSFLKDVWPFVHYNDSPRPRQFIESLYKLLLWRFSVLKAASRYDVTRTRYDT